MRLIDADSLIDELAREPMNTRTYSRASGLILEEPTVQAIPLDKVKQAIQVMDNLANHKIKPISFDQSVAIEMCINIIKRLIIESEE